MSKTLKIDNVDYTSKFTDVGYSVNYEIVSGRNTGVSLSGSTITDEIARHAVITLNCMPLSESDLSALLTAVFASATHSVYYFDPLINNYRTITALREVSEQTYRGMGGTGVNYWTGTVIKFTEN